MIVHYFTWIVRVNCLCCDLGRPMHGNEVTFEVGYPFGMPSNLLLHVVSNPNVGFTVIFSLS